ncbi:N-acetylglucosamine-6-phosphate deacetylase [Paenibacillus koleovorans]|uniref:N-acetylglucosamine-6-phosphate deacetylase n=1 Tax=Paenibacillus koleovorans TaxID=121608 RepID=UPI000FD89F6D|nr:amidohydrolase family protein [Paenibacillus koleovorans]
MAERTERLTAWHYESSAPVSVAIENGRLTAIEELDPRDHACSSEERLYIGPGFVDIQINGFAGRDFTTPPVSERLFSEVSRLLWREGVTSYYPTIVTHEPESIAHSLSVIASCCRQDPDAERAIQGIQLEGPFLSPEDGPRGVHGKAFIRPPDWELFCAWQEAAEGRIKLLTLSPEWPESDKFIRSCVLSGVKVAIGHTAATPKQIRRAADAGAQLSTHLGNGSHLMLPRHPNYIWEQLAEDRLWASVIADGHHLPESVLNVMMKVKEERLLVTTDASFVSGLPPGEYETDAGGRVRLTPEGRLHLAANPAFLAGSAQMQPAVIRHLVRTGLSSLGKAWNMCSVTPAAFIGIDAKHGLTVGAPADLVLFRKRADCSLHIVNTYKEGALVYHDRDSLANWHDWP